MGNFCYCCEFGLSPTDAVDYLKGSSPDSTCYLVVLPHLNNQAIVSVLTEERIFQFL